MQNFKVIFLGGKQAGVIGLLTTISFGCDVRAVVTVSDELRQVAQELQLPVYNSVINVQHLLNDIDLMISVHSREIVPQSLLDIPRLGGINVHPCLSEYKGKNPIQRFLNGSSKQASVGVHKMTELVDMGQTLKEIFIDVNREEVKTVIEVYNLIYPYYSLALIKALQELRND